MKLNSLIPELEVSDIDKSLEFYLNIIRFEILYDRPEEKFAMLKLGGSQLMLEETTLPEGGRFQIAALERPLGRGMNLQIEVSDVDVIFSRCESANPNIVIPMEEKWYRAGDKEVGNRQFVVADPDGYLLRLFEDLGERGKE